MLPMCPMAQLSPNDKDAVGHRDVAKDIILTIANSLDADEPQRA
jgi:hypothetical protein